MTRKLQNLRGTPGVGVPGVSYKKNKHTKERAKKMMESELKVISQYFAIRDNKLDAEKLLEEAEKTFYRNECRTTIIIDFFGIIMDLEKSFGLPSTDRQGGQHSDGEEGNRTSPTGYICKYPSVDLLTSDWLAPESLLEMSCTNLRIGKRFVAPYDLLTIIWKWMVACSNMMTRLKISVRTSTPATWNFKEIIERAEGILSNPSLDKMAWNNKKKDVCELLSSKSVHDPY
ncbi:hypothetical protein CRE_29183 [Caenorhabditis remanei]|uniref:Uncharacterized protein n=1 Tax=Caenorhabditis remanei TaxID=31234 RepID=E3ND44_CAERE|nr:hypothetical protein CRE_29183 [Caenorhabditis remanei]